MVDKEYYSKKLSANRLKQCYDLASPRIQQYLQAEIQFILDHIVGSHVVLELGCGYGRVLAELSKKALEVYGIDTSEESLELARNWLPDQFNVHLYNMNAQAMTFLSGTFDIVIGVQNSLSAFKIPPERIIAESMRVTKPSGKIFLSSYSDKIWEQRLEWFKLQADKGLLGEIDFDQTGNGVIVCKDGFRSSTYTKEDFQTLVDTLDLSAEIVEVDGSSIFCIIEVD